MDVIKIFKEHYTKLYNDMKNTQHGYKDAKDNPYHLEGDVWTHTTMVLKELEKYKDEFTEIGYKILQVACLFHDSGKPYVWVEIDDKKKRFFRGHWNRSFYIVNDMLNGNPFGLSKRNVITIAMLVLNHHRRYESTFSNINSELMTKELNILSECDHNGRIYEKTTTEELPELEYDKSKFKVMDDSKPNIYFLIGSPCSGKSTHIKSSYLENVLSRDDIVMELGGTDDYNINYEKVNQGKVNNELDKRYKEFIRKGEDFYIDMTNMTKKGRRKFMNKNFNSVAILFFTGYDEIIKRNEERENKHIPVKVINKFIRDMSFDFDIEFNDSIYIF